MARSARRRPRPRAGSRGARAPCPPPRSTARARFGWRPRTVRDSDPTSGRVTIVWRGASTSSVRRIWPSIGIVVRSASSVTRTGPWLSSWRAGPGSSGRSWPRAGPGRPAASAAATPAARAKACSARPSGRKLAIPRARYASDPPAGASRAGGRSASGDGCTVGRSGPRCCRCRAHGTRGGAPRPPPRAARRYSSRTLALPVSTRTCWPVSRSRKVSRPTSGRLASRRSEMQIGMTSWRRRASRSARS